MSFLRNFSALVLGVFMLICFPFDTHAVAAYYVSIDGSDANTGSSSSPWRTVEHAVDTAPSGSTIFVRSGDYRYDDSGSFDTENANVSITQSGLTVEAEEGTKLFSFIISGDNNVVRGFDLGLELECERDLSAYTTGCSDDPLKSIRDTFEWGIRVSGDNNLIENNEIHHTDQDGMWVFGKDNVYRGNYIHHIMWRTTDPHNDCWQSWGPIENAWFDGNICEITNTTGSNQLMMLDNNSGTVVRGLKFTNNLFISNDPGYSPLNFVRKDGNPPVEDIYVINNTFVHPNGIGQWIARARGVDGFVVRNNIAVDFGTAYSSYVDASSGTTGVDIGNNLIYKTDDVAPFGGPYEGDIWMQNPQFVDYENLNVRLSESSPAIDSGIDVADFGVQVDFDSVSRPQGTAYDIGAFEFTNVQSPSPTPTYNQADINTDGIVDLRDYSLLVANFFSTDPSPPRADINTDGLVDLRDYSLLVSNFFMTS